MTEHHLKLYYFTGKDVQKDVRRVAVPSDCTWENLLGLVGLLFPQVNLKDFELQYRDAEGDSIVMSSAPEWQECLCLSAYTVKDPLRVAIKKRKGSKCKKQTQPEEPTVAPPQPVIESFFYDEDNNKHEPERLAEVQGVAINVLSLLAPEWMANPDPAALPEELTDVVTVRPLPDGSVDTDISIHRLAQLAGSVALKKHALGDNAAALALLEASHRLRPVEETAHSIEALKAGEPLVKPAEDTVPAEAPTVAPEESPKEQTETVTDLEPVSPVDEVVVVDAPAPETAEPVHEEVPTKFAEQLAVLHGMGFFDDEISVHILEETKGNVVLAIDRLLA
eukprot:TRINITY_DN964_c0_g1_i1.p1 TRINITY_DN964_c0_g1~~TRINITY_DN964_c0_g1_i1.p1  ORF type:complete len:336 (+),score=71.38 TRINITY_DN964_c0_g1_i1:33-1040(+)